MDKDHAPTNTGVSLEAVSSAPSAPGLVVIFSEDPDVHGSFEVHRVCSLGRDPGSAVRVSDLDVSRTHAELEPALDGVLVTDKGSHNGTSIDGLPVRLGRQLAAFGSTLRVGNTLLHVVPDVRLFVTRSVPPDFPIKGGPWIDGLLSDIERIAGQTKPVLIHGETGTGKELVAGALHEASGRRGKLVALNSAAVPRDLVEAELFGHREGAFSGSKSHRLGLFRAADQGTLFLDEIGDLALDCQVKLLRVLDSGEVRPIGEESSVRVDARIVAATHRDLPALVEEGRFRGDLLHRFGARIELPPLRKRRADVPLLAQHFLADRPVRFSALAMERLVCHHWPGNVRELSNVVDDAAGRARHAGRDTIAVKDLGLPDVDPDREIRERMIGALTRHRGNVTKVGRELGMHRSTLYDEFARLGIDAAKFRKR